MVFSYAITHDDRMTFEIDDVGFEPLFPILACFHFSREALAPTDVHVSPRQGFSFAKSSTHDLCHDVLLQA